MDMQTVTCLTVSFHAFPEREGEPEKSYNRSFRPPDICPKVGAASAVSCMMFTGMER